MQTMPHKCKSVPISEETSGGEAQSAQLGYTLLEYFPSASEGYCLSECYQGEPPTLHMCMNETVRVESPSSCHCHRYLSVLVGTQAGSCDNKQ